MRNRILLFVFFLLSFHLLNAQLKTVTLPGTQGTDSVSNGPAATPQNDPAQNNSAQNSNAPMTAKDSLKLALANFKNALSDVGKLFNRKSDTVLIVIPGIDYDNSGLLQLKEKLKNLKAVRSVTMYYSSNTATLEVACKGTPASLWDTLPPDARTAFKVTEMGNTSIGLRCKENAQ